MAIRRAPKGAPRVWIEGGLDERGQLLRPPLTGLETRTEQLTRDLFRRTHGIGRLWAVERSIGGLLPGLYGGGCGGAFFWFARGESNPLALGCMPGALPR